MTDPPSFSCLQADIFEIWTISQIIEGYYITLSDYVACSVAVHWGLLMKAGQWAD